MRSGILWAEVGTHLDVSSQMCGLIDSTVIAKELMTPHLTRELRTNNAFPTLSP